MQENTDGKQPICQHANSRSSVDNYSSLVHERMTCIPRTVEDGDLALTELFPSYGMG